jgi:hypothetical protein
MDDVYKLMLLLGVMTAFLALIGIIGVLGDRREKRKARAKHQAMARQAALLGWEYQPGPDTAFQLMGRTPDGIRWQLAANAVDAEDGMPARTVWSTYAVYAPNVALYVTKRSEYKYRKSWLGRRATPPLVQLFLKSAKEITIVTPEMEHDYVVLVADEGLGYRIFGPETQAAYNAWLTSWRNLKTWPSQFTIQVGAQNLSIEVTDFLDSISAITPLVDLGQVLARSYLKAAQINKPREIKP